MSNSTFLFRFTAGFSPGYFIRMLFLTILLATTSTGVQAQGCNTLTPSFLEFEPCKYRLQIINASECVPPLMTLVVDQGTILSWSANSGAGYTVQPQGSGVYQITYNGPFIPLGTSFPMIFTVPPGSPFSVGLTWEFTCGLGEGCAFGPISLEVCPDPMDASVIGTKYRECNGTPYSSQPALQGWTIQLFNDAGELFREDVTDNTGEYRMFDLPKGQYIVKEIAAPGWTPNVPASGEYLIDLAASQQVVRNFGNCPSCSCDSISILVNQASGTASSGTYCISLLNSDAYCFPAVNLNVGTGQLNGWNLSTGWTAQPVNSQEVNFIPPGGFVPLGASSPGCFNISGAGAQSFNVNTTYGTAPNQVVCGKSFNFMVPPPPPIDTDCCPTGSIPGPELVVNGDFNVTNPANIGFGFITDYAYVFPPGNPMSNGNNAILDQNQAYAVNNQWICPGITGPADTYLAVDGHTMAGKAAWKAQVNVTPGTQYDFCAFARNLVRNDRNYDDPVVQLWVKDGTNPAVMVDQMALPENLNSWQKLNATVTPTSGTMILEIRSGITSGLGNDFAVDKVSFLNCAPANVCTCDSIQLSLQQIGNFIDVCCYRVDVNNSSSNCFPEINVQVDAGLFITTTTPLSPWNVTPQGQQGLLLTHPSGSIPAGVYAPLEFCVAGGSVHNLFVGTHYTDPAGNRVDCDRFETFYCLASDTCACPPNAFNDMSYKPNSGPNVPISCGQVAIWQCQYPTFNLGGNFMCQGTNCPSMPPISWTLTHPNLGQVDQGPASGTGFLISIPNSSFPAPGLYTLLMKGICGDDTCYCEILIETPGCGNSCTADFSGSIDPCGKGTFQGFANGVAPFTYCWDFDGNLATCESTLPNPMYQFPAGVHTVTLKITDAVGCMATYSATFTVPPYPTSVTITGNANICQGQSTVLTAGGWNWTSCQWSNSASGAAITVNAPGTYCVTCVDANGCTASACYTVSQLPPPQVNISGNLNICLGQNTTLTATGGGSYSWAPGGQTTAAITVSPNSTTTYTVTVTGTNGCTATQTVTVNVNALPAADAGPGQTICQWQQATLTASGGVSYQWSPNGSTANPYITPPVQGHTTYTVTVTGANGCTATDVVKVITIVCDCDVNPFVQNGEFTNGNPCLAGDEDIQNATNWNGIWTTVGYSTGDFFNATTCSPSTVSTSLANPAPQSVGNFAGFWCFPHSTNVVWREGILNNLSTANPITPNSGTYMVSMKMACLTNVNGAPRMSVYGVLSGATSTITGTNPLTPFTPANTDLFQLGANPSAAVLLGTVLVPSNCNNNFTDVGFSFNSSILTGPIDRIFLTRDDPTGSNNSNPGGSVYLAVDSICLKPVLDTTACDCGPLDFAFVWQQSTNWYHSIGAAQAALTIPCPKQNATYSFFGAYYCAPDQCGNNQISWKLDRPGVLSDLTGQNSYVAYPFFHVPLNPADFSQAGNYQLTVTRMCGTKECSKVFNVKIDNCPCVCDSLRHDIGYGFSMSNVLFPLNNCKKRFRPLALCQNDQVSWSVSEVNGPFTSSGTSVGNASFQFPLSFPHSGYYTVCMTVVRTVNGQVCNTMQYCRTVYVHCGIDPITEVTRFCEENLIKNSGFRLGGSFGFLNEGSYLENWDAAPNPGDGQVAVDTSDGGSLDEGYVVLRGRSGNFAGIMQEIHLTKDNYIILHMDAINYLGEEAPAGTRIEVRLQKEPLIYPGQESQILYTEMLADSNGWRQIGRAIALPDLDTSLHYLVICLQNDDELRNSIVGLDNIELCASATSPAPETPEAIMQMRIYPNPNAGTFTVDLPQPARADMRMRVVDIMGRIVMEQQAIPGSVRQVIISPNLPSGLYFLQLTEQGNVLGTSKFVKN
ncbi:MAG: T9SS type A sorting domain-containing protein [Saprospiraceae bacterium]|nr:T9SS type A sorting domain-containing protein [Saprospiraceae bacterium]